MFKEIITLYNVFHDIKCDAQEEQTIIYLLWTEEGGSRQSMEISSKKDDVGVFS